jgi:hypothetical protein
MRHICIIALGVLLSTGVRAQVADQHRVKAAFLYNFAKFVEWPPLAFRSPADPVVIGVLGKNPFGDALAVAVAGQTLEGRAFQLRDLANAQQASGCRIVFISSSERKRLKPVFAAIGTSGVLTVGETDNFAAERESSISRSNPDAFVSRSTWRRPGNSGSVSVPNC